MGQASHLDQVWVASDGLTKLAADLRALQRVSETRPRKVTFPRNHHLGLPGQSSQCSRVQDTRAVTLE